MVVRFTERSPFIVSYPDPTLPRERVGSGYETILNTDMAVTAKQAITRERKLFSEICQLKTFVAQQKPGW